jgi:hypothetical protein
MSEVSVRLSELRNASESLKQSASRLQIAVDSVVPIIDQSLLDALPASESSLLYQLHKANISTLPAKITQFAINLENAANDIDTAVDSQQSRTVVHFYAPTQVKIGNSPSISALMGTTSTLGNDVPSSKKMTLDAYVSNRNQPLLDDLKIQQSLLKDKQSAMGFLVNQRSLISEDMTALKNRMLSFDASASVDNHPRIMAYQTQLDALDIQIDTAQIEIDSLQLDVNHLTERLDRVSPAVGAELDAILPLENAENPQWMQDSTFGCVNHIVDKMPLPNGVPRDALLWDDAAQQLPQYGISWGDTPLEGSVLQLDPSHPYADDQYGHVLYVESVNGSDVWVTDNIHPSEPVKLSDITGQLSGDDMRYLYFPWHTGA